MTCNLLVMTVQKHAFDKVSIARRVLPALSVIPMAPGSWNPKPECTLCAFYAPRRIVSCPETERGKLSLLSRAGASTWVHVREGMDVYRWTDGCMPRLTVGLLRGDLHSWWWCVHVLKLSVFSNGRNTEKFRLSKTHETGSDVVGMQPCKQLRFRSPLL